MFKKLIFSFIILCFSSALLAKSSNFSSINVNMIAHLTEKEVLLDTLKHPRIWVSPKDRKGILDNISKYPWANSLFSQLKKNQSSKYLNHAKNPSEEINLIPSLPGDRKIHRTILNDGVECAILYYLTEDEKYAQIASDIVYQYVKIDKY